MSEKSNNNCLYTNILKYYRIVETYTHSECWQSVLWVLNRRYEYLLEREMGPLLLKYFQLTGKYQHHDISIVWKPACSELLHAMLTVINFKTFPMFSVAEVASKKQAHPIVRVHKRRECPYCHSNQRNCCQGRFWEYFSFSPKTENRNWIHIRRCFLTNQLFLVEHPSEIIYCDGLTLQHENSFCYIIDHQMGRRGCPICKNQELKSTEINFCFICKRCKTAVLVYDKNDPDGLQNCLCEYGEHNTKAQVNQQESLRCYIVKPRLPYNGRAIAGPPFNIMDLRREEAGIWQELDERAKEFAQNPLLTVGYRRLIGIFRTAKNYNFLKPYKIQRKTIR